MGQHDHIAKETVSLVQRDRVGKKSIRRKFKETAMKEKMKYFGSTVLLLAAISFTAAACTTTGSTMDDEALYKRMPATKHHKAFPGGHGGGEGKACFYDRADDVYYCSFK